MSFLYYIKQLYPFNFSLVLGSEWIASGCPHQKLYSHYGLPIGIKLCRKDFLLASWKSIIPSLTLVLSVSASLALKGRSKSFNLLVLNLYKTSFRGWGNQIQTFLLRFIFRYFRKSEYSLKYLFLTPKISSSSDFLPAASIISPTLCLLANSSSSLRLIFLVHRSYHFWFIFLIRLLFYSSWIILYCGQNSLINIVPVGKMDNLAFNHCESPAKSSLLSLF